MKKNAIEENREKYDISDLEDLPYFKAGNTMLPAVMKSVGKSFAFYRSLLKEETCVDLMKESPDERCRWLVSHNRSILLRDIDWEKIFYDIFDHTDSFSRYYPMVRVEVSNEGIRAMLRAFVVNDDLYSYAFELEKQFGNAEN